MRSQTEYIITKSEVHAYAEDWLGTALRFEYQGYKCSGSVVLQVLLIAAARVVSVFAACRSLADAPTDQTIRNALAATLPEINGKGAITNSIDAEKLRMSYGYAAFSHFRIAECIREGGASCTEM